jgi:DNA-binding MarR family transcriptional regulator
MESNSPPTPADRTPAREPAAPLEIHLGYWLRLVSNEVSGAFARALQERRISVAEWVALSRIATLAELTPARLAAAMSMTRGAVTKILDKLEAKKLVSRTPSRRDNRVQLLSLTGLGRRILPGLTTIADGNDSHFFAVLSQDEQAALRSLLRKLAEIHRIVRTPVE